MNAGDTFRYIQFEDHLWIVLSDPVRDAQQVLIVNVTSWRKDKDQACLLNPGDHPFVQHNSCVNYEDSIITTLTHLLDLFNRGRIKLFDPLPEPILQYIRNRAGYSTRIAIGKWQLLVDQGLVSE